MNVSLLWGRLVRRLALEGASPRIKRICADAHIRIYAHTYHHVCVRAFAHIYSELAFKVHTKESMSASPPPAPHRLPPQNDLGQSYSASTSSSILQLFSSPLSINLAKNPNGVEPS